ncbi:MAG: hypothetical protein PUC24_04320 [Oscillospiraceae bacterium]|nr:hypothetical protein [Oscillospiraceae bacterium]
MCMGGNGTWTCPRQNECRYHKDVNPNTDNYCLGVLARRADCQGFEPRRVPQVVTAEQDLPPYAQVERANPGYLVFFDGIEQDWYIAFGRTAVKLGREFGYTVDRGTTGIGKINWEAGKRRYLAMDYGILLKRGNVEIERIAPQKTQPEQVTQPERETQPEQVTQPEEDGTEKPRVIELNAVPVYDPPSDGLCPTCRKELIRTIRGYSLFLKCPDADCNFRCWIPGSGSDSDVEYRVKPRQKKQ